MNLPHSPSKKERNPYHEYSFKSKFFHLNQSPFSSKQQSTKQQVSLKQQILVSKQTNMLLQVNQAFSIARAYQIGQRLTHVASSQDLIKYSTEGFVKKKTLGRNELKDKKNSQKYLEYYDLRNENIKGMKYKNKLFKKLEDSGDSQASCTSSNSVNSQGNIKFSFRSFPKLQSPNKDDIIKDKLLYQKKQALNNCQERLQIKKKENNTYQCQNSIKKWFPDSAKKEQLNLNIISSEFKEDTKYNMNLTPRGFEKLCDLQAKIRASVSPKNKQVYSPSYKNNFHNKIIERKVTPNKKVPKFISPQQKHSKQIAISPGKEVFFNHRKTLSKVKSQNHIDNSISFSKEKSAFFYEPNIQCSIYDKSISEKKHRNSIDQQVGRRRAISKCSNNRITLFALNSEFPEYYEFIILRTIAQHKQSVVALCIQVNTKAVFCIKKCKVTKNNLNQLIMEHKVGYLNSHPNLVQTFCTFFDKESFYIVMEYMEGGTMLNTCKNFDLKEKRMASIHPRQTLSRFRNITALNKPQNSKDILKQILEGVKYLHQNKIIHRDIKPQNIYMTHNNFKIGDFGSSTYVTGCDYVGTLDYAAPEIMLKQKYTETIDIWSIGCIAYELEVGRPPFYHVDRNQTIRRIINVEYDLSLITDSNLRNLISKMLIKNGSMRISANKALKEAYFCQIAFSRNRI